MSDLRFGIIGAGFWAPYQLAGWRTVGGVRCAAVCDRVRDRAEALARSAGGAAVYESAEEMVARERLDFLEVVSDVGSHRRFVELAAARGIAAISQKPMAPSLEDAEAMVAAARAAGISFSVHENWRWQRPIRALREAIREPDLGRVFRARIDFCSSFPVFENQPFLREVERFIIADMGSHILDVARFLFGEAGSVYCQTHRIHRRIRGEDVATVVMRMASGATVTSNLSYASRLEKERFPETFILVECEGGSVELAPGCWIRITRGKETTARQVLPAPYDWIDPTYALVQSSIVDCDRDLLRALKSGSAAETSGEDNLKTVRLVSAAYDSAREDRVVRLIP